MHVIYKTDLPKKIVALSPMHERAFVPARKRAAGSSGFYLMGKVREQIESEGHGTWPKDHPLSKALKKINGRWVKRQGKFSAYYDLAKFARYKKTRDSKRIEIGFGKFSKRDKAGKFDRYLQKIANNAQIQRHFYVNAKMQRLFGATRRNADDEIGKDFFAVRKGTMLVVKKRPIMKPVLQREEGVTFTIFRQKYYESVKKRYERL